MTDEDFSFAKQAEYLDKLVRELMQEGMDITEIMNMPYNYIVDILEEKHKKEVYANSFFDLLG